jgi:hypothetical protein
LHACTEKKHDGKDEHIIWFSAGGTMASTESCMHHGTGVYPPDIHDLSEEEMDPFCVDDGDEDVACCEDYHRWEDEMLDDLCRREEELHAEKSRQQGEEDSGDEEEDLFEEEREVERPFRRDGALRKDGVPKRRPGPTRGTKYHKGGKPRPHAAGMRGKWERTKPWRQAHSKSLTEMVKTSGMLLRHAVQNSNTFTHT